MKKIILITVAVLLFNLFSSAGTADSLQQRKLSLNLTELLFLDFKVSYVWQISEKNAWRLTLGYKPKTKNVVFEKRSSIFRLPYSMPSLYADGAANNFYAGIAREWLRSNSFRFSSELFYKYIRTGEYLYGYMDNNYYFQYFLDDLEAHVTGIKILLEKDMFKLFSDDNSSASISFFTGLGIRVNHVERKTIASGYSSREYPDDLITLERKNNPFYERKWSLWPSLQLGFKCNFIWYK